MPYKPIHESEHLLLYYHIDLYYKSVKKKPIIRKNVEMQLQQINRISKKYKEELRSYPKFDYDKYENEFDRLMEVLTQAKTITEKENARATRSYNWRRMAENEAAIDLSE